MRYLLLITFLTWPSFGQTILPTPAKERLSGFQKRLDMQYNSLVRQVPFRSIGPTIMSGRVTDIDASPDDPTHFYVAYASGGLWQSLNNGISFSPIFDYEASMSIGDIAVDWKHGETIWIGTGENNSSRSSYSGTGIYKSTDSGKTWIFCGLEESHHIGRIVIHPNNPQTLWVAAAGHLYSPNSERGVYKTTDGGLSWKQVLFIDDQTGAIDLVADPNDPNILYAAMWHRERYSWDMIESGATSGMYKSTDGGETWNCLTVEGSGFPAGDGVGRIGIDVSRTHSQTLYAILDNQNRRPKESQSDHILTKETLRTMSKEDFLKLNNDQINRFLDDNGFPEYYHADTIKELVTSDQILPSALVEFLEDANALLFETPVIGMEIYRSDDGGKTWRRTHENYLEDTYYSFGYYFGQIRIAPDNPEKIYVLGVPIITSDDGGKSLRYIGGDNVHVDHHALWVNPNRKGHLILGNDGGVNISYDDGVHWFKANTPPVGQVYAIAVDMEKPYNVYAGFQDNGVWWGPSSYKAGYSWYSEGNYPYKEIYSGDGMQVAVDTRDNQTIYVGYQFGYYTRINKKTLEQLSVKPTHRLGERPYRHNWQTPIYLSRHNQDIFYIGSHRLHRSLDQGKTFEVLSPDLTKGGRSGDVPYGTLTVIRESPVKFGIIYTGSDDGYIHITKDGGYTWTRISDNLPQDLWVSSIEASYKDTGTVYAALNGYRYDNFEVHLYMSRNFGKKWERIGLDLPSEPVNVIREDPFNPNILYVGTDHGVYVSLDRGKTFMGMFKNFPAVAVHDLIIHPRDRELVIGTHGRSVFIAPVDHVEKLTNELIEKPLHCFPMRSIDFNKNWGKAPDGWGQPDETKIQIGFYAKQPAPTILRIKGEGDVILKTIVDTCVAGLNYVEYNLSADSVSIDKHLKNVDKKLKSSERKKWEITRAPNGQFYLPAGTYTIEIGTSGVKEKQTLTIKPPKRRTRGAVEKR